MSTTDLEIPFDLAAKWDDMLKQSGRCVTYWEIAKWAYEKGQADQRNTIPHDYPAALEVTP
jgi:hypothetical protein